MGILSGLQNMLSKANTGTPESPSFVDRLGTFGARLQDIDDGGDRAKTMQASRAASLKSAEQKKQSDYLDELAQRIGLSPGERLLMRVSPDKAAEVLSKKLSPLVVGGQVYQEGEFKAPTEYGVKDGLGYSVGPQGLQELGRLSPSYAEETDRMKLNTPVSVGDGASLVDPRTGKPIYNNPKTFAPQKPAGGALSSMTTEQLIALAGSLK